MSAYSHMRTVVFALTASVLGFVGLYALASKYGPSLADEHRTVALLAGQPGSDTMCISTDENKQPYFVGCGGFF